MAIAKQINHCDVMIASLQAPFQFSYPFGIAGFSVRHSEDVKIGFGWATRWKDIESISLHHRNLLKLIDVISHEYHLDESKIFLLAFSQPVALNYRFIFSNPGLICGAVAVCGGIPGDWKTAPYRKSETDILHIATEQDPYYALERSQTFQTLLAERATTVDFRVYKGGHRFPRQAIPFISRWLKERFA